MVNIALRGHVPKCSLSFSRALGGPTGSRQRGAMGHLMWPFYLCADVARTKYRELRFLKIIIVKTYSFVYTALVTVMSLQHVNTSRCVLKHCPAFRKLRCMWCGLGWSFDRVTKKSIAILQMTYSFCLEFIAQIWHS